MIAALTTERAAILHGDSLRLPFSDCSIDAVVTDPPYGIHFMNKSWDQFTQGALGHGAEKARGGGRERGASMHAGEYDLSLNGARVHQEWAEAVGRGLLRVLKPGGHVLWFGSPRAHHRAVSGLEDAGFEIRDSLHWFYGSGFPKSLNVGEGRGTALKPGHEPIVMARKPLEGTVAANLAKWGTGALNIDACRLAGMDVPDGRLRHGGGAPSEHVRQLDPDKRNVMPAGRWPSNVLLDEDAAKELDFQTADLRAGGRLKGGEGGERSLFSPLSLGPRSEWEPYGDSGGASRFFYVAKPGRKERDFGCEALPQKSAGEATDREDGTAGLNNPRAGAGRTGGARNFHPTVKPVQLMRYLCRLITPPGGTVLDPFLGSGTTGIAALAEGFNFVGVEKSEEYLPIAIARISRALEAA